MKLIERERHDGKGGKTNERGGGEHVSHVIT
jgi:hypothetical protein